MQAARDLFVTGLKNAHAMERQAQELMERQVERMDDYPTVQQRLRKHLDETREQLKRIDSALASFDESPSTMKDMATAFGANVQAMTHSMAGDEVLKNTFANNAFEHFEIAAYKSLIALNEHGKLGADGWLAQSLREEEEMAAWVDEHVPQITLEFLRKEEQAAA